MISTSNQISHETVSHSIAAITLPRLDQPEKFGQLWMQFDKARQTINSLPGSQLEKDQLFKELTAKRIEAYQPVANHIARTFLGSKEDPVAIGNGFACVVFKVEDNAVSIGSAYWRYLRRQMVSSLGLEAGVNTPRTHHVGEHPIPFSISEFAPGATLLSTFYSPTVNQDARSALRLEMSFKIGALAKGLENVTFDEFGWKPVLPGQSPHDVLQGICKTWAEYVDYKYQKTPAAQLYNPATRSGLLEAFAHANWTVSEINHLIDTVDQVRSWNLTPTLTHGDLHLWNIVEHEGKFSLLDWGETRAAGGIIEELADWKFSPPHSTDTDIAAALEGYGISPSERATYLNRVKQLEILEEMHRINWRVTSENILTDESLRKLSELRVK